MGSAVTAPNAFVAAATRLTDAPTRKIIKASKPSWAVDAWNFYDTVGEFRYAADWKGSMISKARLYVADEDGKEVTSGPAFEILKALYGGPDRQPEMLKSFGVHLTVAGDCYLAGTDQNGVDQWGVIAASSLSTRAGKYYDDGVLIESSGSPFLMRLWNPHPRKPSDANSPARAVLPILSEIDGLTRHVASQIDSRLTGAGLLMLPSEMTFPTTPVTTSDGEEGTTRQEPVNKASEFIRTLGEVMSQAISDPESASARVPIVVTAAGDQIGNAQLLQFWTDLDEHAIELRKEAISRLALGLDMPPEVMTGLADTNHWNAWAIDESAIKVHAEPALELITSSLTEGYLQPVLSEEVDEQEAQRYTVQADTSGIRLRPNRSQEAIELYDRGQLSAEALRRETGFDPEDAPQDPERVEWLIRKVASGSTTPELVAEALQILGAPFEQPAIEAETTEERPTPSLEDHPTQDPPEIPDQLSVLTAASEQMVYRALERAGNRLKTKLNGNRPPGVAAVDLYRYVPCSQRMAEDLLTDAWAHIPRFCTSLSVDPDRLTRALDSYCRVLLSGQIEHDRELLAKYLSQVSGLTMNNHEVITHDGN